ncbi:MAG TPA: 23S rRNA (uracil(1939)-C(5))-methyltransferase RlmD [Candidatus Nitrosotalea sp.]|nr:23S rRNA (uracil(1939)-C(5))-methyltransferase RlmD [Candidatus Nitrosotalea sp.]
MTSRDTPPKSEAPLRGGDELELAFSDLLANGQGVGRAGGLVVFCFGPLPGEIARVRVATVKQRYAVANLIEVLRESPERTQPFCPVFGACGGCQLQHLDYPAQLAWKRETVRAALERIGGIAGAGVSETLGMARPREYRNKMALVVDPTRDPAALGFYRQRTHDVVPIAACPVVSPALNAGLAKLDAMRRAEPMKTVLREARHLVARSASSGESVLAIATQRSSESARGAAPSLLRAIPNLAGVSNSFDPASTNAILGRRQRVIAGEDEIEERIGGVVYRVSSGSFFQVNVEIVGRIFDYLAPLLKKPMKVVDLFCGVGTFALYFAKNGSSVYGIEESAQAVAEAQANARRNGLEGSVRFTAGRVEQLAGSPAVSKSLREANVLFLDPPRKGCDEVTLQAIARARVPELWYLSCDPATLARDLKFLVAKGYRLGTVQPFDMFPQTGHVETFVRMEYS